MRRGCLQHSQGELQAAEVTDSSLYSGMCSCHTWVWVRGHVGMLLTVTDCC
jgi:hypothetical protein